MNDAVAGLNLPLAVKMQTLKLLACICEAANADELWRVSDRAAGFVSRLETVDALQAVRIQSLYDAFEEAATARRREESQ